MIVGGHILQARRCAETDARVQRRCGLRACASRERSACVSSKRLLLSPGLAIAHGFLELERTRVHCCPLRRCARFWSPVPNFPPQKSVLSTLNVVASIASCGNRDTHLHKCVLLFFGILYLYLWLLLLLFFHESIGFRQNRKGLFVFCCKSAPRHDCEPPPPLRCCVLNHSRHACVQP